MGRFDVVEGDERGRRGNQGQGSYRRYDRPIRPTSSLRNRPVLGLALVAVVIVAAAVAVLAVAADDGRETFRSTSPTSTSAGATAAPAGTGDLPAAPWRSAPVARDAVAEAFVTAWQRATNRTGCALLFPLDGGPALEDAEPTEERTPDDRGWDIFLTGEAGSVEILGLFDKTAQPGRPPGPPSFTRRWSDGSVARYGPEAGRVAGGTADPATFPYEAVLTLPDQSCQYRIYDTLGREHLEALFARLRLMAP